MELQGNITFKYGLIVIDTEDIDAEGETAVIHFVGYTYEPTKLDADELYHKLLSEKEFGLTKVIDSLTIAEAPLEIVELYRNQDVEWTIRQN
jgi:hypothetical protein